MSTRWSCDPDDPNVELQAIMKTREKGPGELRTRCSVEEVAKRGSEERWRRKAAKGGA